MLILAIESSCDETSIAVTDGRRVLSNVIATQIAEHTLATPRAMRIWAP